MKSQQGHVDSMSCAALQTVQHSIPLRAPSSPPDTPMPMYIRPCDCSLAARASVFSYLPPDACDHERHDMSLMRALTEMMHGILVPFYLLLAGGTQDNAQQMLPREQSHSRVGSCRDSPTGCG